VHDAVSAEERFAPEQLVAALNAADVRFVIVGGLAAGTHGVVRATRDIDLVPDPAVDNMRRLAGVLGRLGGQHPIAEELTGESLGRPASMKVSTRLGEVHVLNRMPGTPPFEQLADECLTVEIAPGVDAAVCSLRHLRQMKAASGRPRDAVDLAELDELHGPPDD